ncbi:MAG: hypothetical protein V4812_00890 [Pseudomonadota bacterium]
MNATHSRFALSGLGLALLLAGTQAQAQTPAAALISQMVKGAPQGGQSHTVQVQLDKQGHWSLVPSKIVKMRIEYSHNWAYKPNMSGSNAWVSVGQALPKDPKSIEGGDSFNKGQSSVLSRAQMLAKSGIMNFDVPFEYLVPAGIPGADISAYCLLEKENRLKQGKTLNAVLRQGFTVKLHTPINLGGWYYETAGANSSRPDSYHQYSVDKTAPVVIQCLGNPAIADQVAPLTNMQGPDGLTVQPFTVSGVELVALPYPASTVCPTEITLKATVKGVGGGEIKYWLEALNGQDAAVQQASTLPGKPGEASQRVIMQKVSLKPDPLQKPQGIDSLKANTQGSLVKRSYRFNVLTPNKLQSQKVDLEVLCTSTLNVGLGAHGNSVKTSPPPQPPKPELPLQAVPVEPQPPKPELQLQAAPVQPPKPELQLQAAPVQPPKPELQLQAAPVQPSMPELQLQAAPVQPPQPELQLRAPQTQPVRPQPMRLQGIQPQPPKRVGTLQPQQP